MSDQLPAGARVRVRADVVGYVEEPYPPGVPGVVWVAVSVGGDVKVRVPTSWVSVEELPARGAFVNPARDPELPRGSVLRVFMNVGEQVAYRGSPESGVDDMWCWGLTGDRARYSWRQLPGVRWQVIEVPADA